MKKVIFLVLIIICIALLSGCEAIEYPYVAYINSNYRFDPYDRRIEIPNGYILDQGYSYNMVETESGYDLVIHLIKGEGDI
jgi:hypothetical protein